MSVAVTVYRLHKLNQDELNKDIKALRFSKSAKLGPFRSAGISTIRDILIGDSLDIKGVGYLTLAELEECLDALSRSMQTDGSVDWDRFAVDRQTPVVPTSDEVRVDNFLSFFPEVVSAIEQNLAAFDQTIFCEICNPTQTLEQIGDGRPGGVSIERVRQRKRRLVESLAAALFLGAQGTLPIHFRLSFAAIWRTGKPAFGQSLSRTELVQHLCTVWQTRPSDLERYVPLLATLASAAAGLRS